MITNTLPEKFNFKIYYDKRVFTAKLKDDGYTITWDNTDPSDTYTSAVYTVSSTKRIVNQGDWMIINEDKVSQCNGIDADGNQFNFTVDMLELCQVVQTRDSRMYLVVPNDKDEVALVSPSGANWISSPSIKGPYQYKCYDIVNVWEPNYPFFTFDFDNKQGKLVWSANITETQEDKDITELEKSIKSDTLKLAEMKLKNGK
jgi:hypothetical protein